MTISEIRCDACGRRFQTLDQPVHQTAAASGWHVTDITLCPGCSAAAVEPADSYGRHRREDDLRSEIEYWTRLYAHVCSYPLGTFRDSRRHRITDTRRMTVDLLAQAVAA